MTSSLNLARTYTSFSGVDIKVIIDGSVVGTMQAVSYAIQREKAPIYVMGRVDPLSFSRGKRGIAGTMISIMLDQHLVYSKPWAESKVVLDNHEIIPTEFGTDGSLKSADTSLSTLGGTAPGDIVTSASSDLSDDFEMRGAYYVDQITPFDISIVAVNEYGKAAMMRIYGCEILNEGSGFSIDDIVIENQMTYICRTILPWKQMGSWETGKYQPVGVSAQTQTP